MTMDAVKNLAHQRGYALRKTRNVDEYTLVHKRTGYAVCSYPERAWIGMGDIIERVLRRVP